MTYNLIKELFDYNEETGLLTSRVNRGSRVRIGDEVGYRNPNGYRVAEINKKPYRVHRIIWLWMTGAWPKLEIDHINGTRDDNRWCNLREATSSQNGRNRTRLGSNNTSGQRNIYWYKAYEKWKVFVVRGGKVYGGYHENMDDAIAERDSLLRRFDGEFYLKING